MNRAKLHRALDTVIDCQHKAKAADVLSDVDLNSNFGALKRIVELGSEWRGAPKSAATTKAINREVAMFEKTKSSTLQGIQEKIQAYQKLAQRIESLKI